MDDESGTEDKSKSDLKYFINKNGSRKREFSLIEDEDNNLSDDENETSKLKNIENSTNEESNVTFTVPSPKLYSEILQEYNIIESEVVYYVHFIKRIKTRRICFYTKSQQTFFVTASITASDNPNNEFANGIIDKGNVKNILSHDASTDIEDSSTECYIEHKFIGFLNIWETARHSNTFCLLAQPEIRNRIPRDIPISRQIRGTFFHPIQVCRFQPRRNSQTGRLSINNGVITRVVWARGGPRTIVVRKQPQFRKFIIPIEDGYTRHVNIMYEYESEVDGCNDYIETIRRVTGTNNNQSYDSNDSVTISSNLNGFSSQF
uniref:Tub domain-containing protein n=1 Tax=Strongyloides papillosus TaxID=174720 RepID=A0A0N5BDR1_STREA